MKWEDSLVSYRTQRSFDPKLWIDEKCKKFNDYLVTHGISGAVLSVSGGVDSAVTLALLVHTMSLSNSNLKKICAVNQPIHSSGWAYNRAKELCDKFGVEMVTIDQTETHKELIGLVNKSCNYTGTVFSDGQLRSYMRTPINYYLSQLQSESGFPSVVMGTGNADEDGYLAYYCKYGDGAVDVQLINDLHKSEVFKVGKYLGVPESILTAPPSADLWENQEDEKELGFSYDFIELFTGYFLKLDPNNQEKMIDSLDKDSKEEFLKNKEACEKVHMRNLHKINGVVNI